MHGLNPCFLVFLTSVKIRSYSHPLFLAFAIMPNFFMGAQPPDFSKQGALQQMAALNDQAKIKFINENFYALYSADFNNASELTKWASQVARQNNWKLDEAYSLFHRGMITYLSGKYDEVLGSYLKALDLFDSLNHKAGLAAAYNEVAVFYYKQKDFSRCFQSLDSAEKYAREINDLELLGTNLGHRGAILSVQNRIEEAKPYYLEVYEIRKQTRDSVGLGYVYLDLSEIALHENKASLSLQYLDSSKIIREAIGDWQGVAATHVTHGEFLNRMGKPLDALKQLKKGLAMASEIGYTDLVKYSYNEIAGIYISIGDYKNALAYKENYYTLNDSLFNLQRMQVIQEIQTRYETEKKDQQITYLDAENKLSKATIQKNSFLIVGLVLTVALLTIVFYLIRIRDKFKQQAVLQEQKARFREAQINSVIDSQEKERKRFASDLHDGIGQLVTALNLNIQSIKEKGSTEKQVELVENSEQLLADLQNEIRNVAFNLMPPVLIKEGLIPAIKELARKINQSKKVSINLYVHEANDRLDGLTEISIYRIAQELISNILKHSNASNINLSFTGFDDHLNITFEDDGIGFDPENFKSSKSGNGWTNIQSRINLMQGQIEIDSKPGRKNTTVIINVPNKVTSLKPMDPKKYQDLRI